MRKISAAGLFCCDKFEETPNKKLSDLSKLTKPYFSGAKLFLAIALKERSMLTLIPHRFDGNLAWINRESCMIERLIYTVFL